MDRREPAERGQAPSPAPLAEGDRATFPGQAREHLVEGGFHDSDLLTLAALSDVVFCERRAALHVVERLWQDNLFTAEGTVAHERVHSLTKTEVRGDLRISRGLLIRSLQLGLSGKADVIEFHRVKDVLDTPMRDDRVSVTRLPGVAGWWRPYPVEYKRGQLRSNRSFEVQLCAQAMCLEEMLGVAISQGAIFFGQTARRLEIEFDSELRTDTKTAAARLHEIVRTGTTPRAKYENKCKKCSLLDVCIPQITGRRSSVSSYVRRMLRGEKELSP